MWSVLCWICGGNARSVATGTKTSGPGSPIGAVGPGLSEESMGDRDVSVGTMVGPTGGTVITPSVGKTVLID